MKFADLHVHSNFSDGTFSPQQVVQEAMKAGLSCISITDHDTVNAIDIAVSVAENNLEVISGIELTSELEGQEIHILGYFIDYKNDDFLKMLTAMRQIRVNRVYDICEKLNGLGVKMNPQDVFNIAGIGSVGRLHIARVMCEKGFVFSIQEAFNNYIGNNGTAYVGKFKMTPKEAIDWIVKVGGIPVLAHPYILKSNAIISDFVKAGLRGIEVFYTKHSKYHQAEFLQIADKYGLLITGGSDCHGLAKDEAQIGKVKLPYEYIEKLKKAKI